MPELDAAIHDVDALVSDEPWDVGASDGTPVSATPKPPPGLGLPAPPGIVPTRPTPPPLGLRSKLSTTSPIGAKPSTLLASAPIIKPNAAGTTVPPDPSTAVTVVSTPVASPRTNAKSSTTSTLSATPERPNTLAKIAAAAAKVEERSKKDGTASSSSAESVAPQTPRTPNIKPPMRAVSTSILHDEDFPALDSRKTHNVRTPISNNISRGLATNSPKRSLVESATKPKRPIVLSLNTSVPTPSKASSIKMATPIETPAVMTRSVSTTTIHPASPATRAVPRSIRLTGTTLNKSDSAPLASPIVMTPSSVTSHLQRPSTPTSNSEIISDSASIVSGSISISRTSSPPPISNRVGTAPVRITTKSQQRKQRKDQLKVDTVATESMLSPDKEITHAPIMGRKKKQKKEKPTPVKKGATLNITTPVSSDDKTNTNDTFAADNVAVATLNGSSEVQNSRTANPPKTSSLVAPVSGAPGNVTRTSDEAVAAGKKGKGLKGQKDKVNEVASTAFSVKPTKNSSSGETQGKSERVQVKDVAAKKEPLIITADQAATEVTSQTEKSTEVQKGQTPTPDTSEPTLPEIFAELQAKNSLPRADKLSFLKPLSGDNTKAEVEKVFTVPDASPGDSGKESVENSNASKAQADMLEDTANSILTAEEKKQLYEGQAVRKIRDGSRVLITPNGDFIRNLSHEEEDLYMYYQGKLASDLHNPRTFVFDLYRRGSQGFTLVNNRAVPNGPPSFFPQATDGKVRDPVSKIQRDEAISYINQFVLPRLQLDRQAPSSTHIMRDAATDASLNSLAPFIYNYDVPPTQMYGASGFNGDETAGFLTTSPMATPIDHRSPSTVGGYPATSASASPLNDARNSFSADRSGLSLQSPPPMSVEDSEKALAVARREVEKAEAKLNQVIRNNRHLILGTGH
ncbi:uncharacterized protein BROUX77_001863 [Berkeleyomyces rouxiae]|uniref:uncharacterized protein n=1 Tax=Berkeleyomyces rouxiae TaxID=2035830 RepID=UPI003B7DAC38